MIRNGRRRIEGSQWSPGAARQAKTAGTDAANWQVRVKIATPKVEAGWLEDGILEPHSAAGKR